MKEEGWWPGWDGCIAMLFMMAMVGWTIYAVGRWLFNE